MKSAYGASFHGGKRSFRREQCDTCQKETIFQGWQCTTCKVMQRRDMNGGIPKDTRPMGWTEIQSANLRTARRIHSIRSDKRDAIRRQAEASRAKFEGGK